MILAELKSLRWADLLLYSLLDPRSLYRQINRNEPRSFALSFLMPAAVAIIELLTLSLLGKQTPFFYYKVTYGWILLFLCQALISVIAASLMDMASQFFGWKGNIREFTMASVKNIFSVTWPSFANGFTDDSGKTRCLTGCSLLVGALKPLPFRG